MEMIGALSCLHMLTRFVLIPFKLKQLMIVGIDCYHDTLSGKQSIAGFVASLNEKMTR